MAIDFTDLRRKVNEFLDDVIGQQFDVTTAAAKDGEGVLKSRVFNSKDGAKDVDGNTLGGYASDSQRRKRRSRGRQVRKKDFNVTGSLQLSIKTVENRSLDEATVEWVDEEARIIAGGLEEQGAVGAGRSGERTIFSLSQTEVQGVQDRTESIILNVINDAAARILT